MSEHKKKKSRSSSRPRTETPSVTSPDTSGINNTGGRTRTVEHLNSRTSSQHSNTSFSTCSGRKDNGKREETEEGVRAATRSSNHGSFTPSSGHSDSIELKRKSSHKKKNRRRRHTTNQEQYSEDDDHLDDRRSQLQEEQPTPPVIILDDLARLGNNNHSNSQQTRLSEDDDLERVTPEVTAALLGSNGSLRGLSTDEAVTKLIDTAQDVLKQYHAPRTHAQLFRKYLQYPPTIPLIIIILSLLTFYIYGTIHSSPRQFRVTGTIVEVAILTAIVVWNAFLIRREQQLKGREVRDRVKGIITELESIRTLGTQDLKIPTVPSVSTVRVIRSGVVKTLPSNLIVKGDLIEMVYGDVAPCHVLCVMTRRQLSRLSFSDDLPSPQHHGDDRESMATATVHSGQQFLHTQLYPLLQHSTSADMREFFLSAKEIFQPSLFGFPPTDEMQVRHLNRQGRYTFEVLETPLEKILHTALDPTPRPRSLIQKQLVAIHQVIFRKIIPGIAILAFGINLLRYIIKEVIDLGHATQGVEQLLVLPTYAILPLMMLSMPSLLQISKAYCNATILVLFNTLQISKTEYEDDQDVDEFDVEAPPPTKNVSIGRREVLSRFWKLLTRWGKSGREFDDGLTRSTNLVESLGGVTVICSIDKEGTIATVFPEAEQVFIATEGGDTEILDVTEDALTPRGIRFEEKDWASHLPSLKPIGLNQLLNTKCDTTLLSAHRRHESHRKYTGLQAHGRNRAAQQTCLCRLGKEIGFSEEALRPFELQREIFCYHPYLPSAAGGSRRILGSRATFEIPTMLSTIYHDASSDGYLLLTDGHVECVVECCSDFWDGSGVQELDDTMLKKISDFYQTAILNDMQCVSYAYRPIALPNGALVPGKGGKYPYEMITLPYIDIGSSDSGSINESRRGSQSSQGSSSSSSSAGAAAVGADASSVKLDAAPTSGGKNAVHKDPLHPMVRARAATSSDNLPGSIIIETDITPEEEEPPVLQRYQERGRRQSVADSKQRPESTYPDSSIQIDIPHSDDEKAGMSSGFGGFASGNGEGGDTTAVGEDMDDVDDESSIEIVVGEGINIPHMPADADTEDVPITGTAAALARIDAGPLRRWRHLRELQNLVNALEEGDGDEESGNRREKHPLEGSSSGEAASKEEGGQKVDSGIQEDDDPAESMCEQLPTTPREFAEQVVQGQIFLGMVTLAHQPKTNVCDFIEDLGLAGIRFVYFSPSSERESKAFADRLGLETDWNSCILLSSETDPFGASTGYLESYDIKAQLPRGIENIRPHLETTDDIPLHVSLFAECGSEAATEMIQIFQDYGEVVCCIGSSLNINNHAAFAKADISIGMEPIRMHPSSEVKSTFSLGAKINGVSCGLMMHSETSLYALTQIVREARRLLNSQRQGSAFMMASFLSVSLLLLISYCFLLPPAMTGYHMLWLMWVIIPILALSFFFTPHEPDTMTTMPSKNTAPLKDLPRFIVHFLVRFTLPIGMCVLVFLYTLHIYDGQEGFRFLFNSFGNGLPWLEWPAPEQWALLYAQNFTLLVWVWYMVWISSSFMSRSLPMRAFRPWKNRVWIGAGIVCMVLQMAFCVISLIKGPHQASAVPWWLIVLAFLWPALFMPIQEVAKAHDRKEYIRAQKLAKLEFNTKLGMHSPL